ncbi:MAG: hypothetical protein PHD43_16990, partial [Methylococcales bacterium]|nr:hypothetical protein [Methylococcales bacterium]
SNLKQTRYTRALKQSQSFDFLYSSITGFKRVAQYTALALGLLCAPYFAQAEENAVNSNLLVLVESYAQEIGDARAEERWTRIEFGTTYIDPVVVVEGSIANAESIYVLGIRNIDAMGFEVSLKNCITATGIPVQETVNYAVIEKSQLPLTEDANTEVRQQFSWGECAADEDTTAS